MNAVLFGLLGLVALSAAVLSFDALLGLALACGFAPLLAWMLPLVIDAGAAAGTLAWLARTGATRAFGRVLALVLLAGSVAGNALGHGLAAYSVAPAWWLVSLVSAIPPAVLAAVVHLAVLAGRGRPPGGGEDGHPGGGLVTTPPAEDEETDIVPVAAGCESLPGELVDAHGLSRLWDDAPPAEPVPDDPAEPEPAGDGGRDRAAELIAEGAGRRRLARELDITEHAARELLAVRRNRHHATAGRGSV